jgi:hypothetical protein
MVQLEKQQLKPLIYPLSQTLDQVLTTTPSHVSVGEATVHSSSSLRYRPRLQVQPAA